MFNPAYYTSYCPMLIKVDSLGNGVVDSTDYYYDGNANDNYTSSFGNDAVFVAAALEDDLRARLSKELTDKNVEIEQLKGQLSVRMLDRIAFRSGSTTILPEGMEALNKLAEAIKGSTDTIRIEGHTDDTPISERLLSRYPSNWELSAARAASVARYFETKHQIDPKRLESAGFSMYRPVAPNDSPENKERNRRVEIVLKPAADPEVSPTKPESKP